MLPSYNLYYVGVGCETYEKIKLISRAIGYAVNGMQILCNYANVCLNCIASNTFYLHHIVKDLFNMHKSNVKVGQYLKDIHCLWYNIVLNSYKNKCFYEMKLQRP